MQTGHEKTLTGLLPALAGANQIYGAGMIESGVTFDLGQLVMDNEIARMIKFAVGGIATPFALRPELLNDLKTVVSEACNNAVDHAYRGGTGAIAVRVDGGRVRPEFTTCCHI